MLRLKAMTFNMQNGQVWDPRRPDDAPIELDRTIAFLREQACDIIFLQELELPQAGLTSDHHHPNFDGLSAALSDYHSSFAYPSATRPHLPFGVGLAIFSRWPLLREFHVILPAADLKFVYQGKNWLPAERSIIGANIEIDGQEIMLLNTHLQAYFMIEGNSDEFPQQRQVLEILLQGRKYPVLLGGDFNCTEQEGTIAGIEATGLKTLQNRQITWHRMPLVLDHIFYSPEFKVEDRAVVATDVSDHDAVSGIFSLKP